jgi:hemolysin-activating ACP:hemolysin acyltransferase
MDGNDVAVDASRSPNARGANGSAARADVAAGPDAGTDPRATRPNADGGVVFSAWRPGSPPLSLGLAVGFLRNKPAFAKLQFGEWSQVLITQIDRGHFFFVIDPHRKIRGFLGWALTSRSLAEAWVEGRAGLRKQDCLAGDSVIINAWSADTPGVNRFLVVTARRIFAGKRALYFKRHYPDRRSRPMRLNVNDFVAGHLSRNRSGAGPAAEKAE